VLPQGAVGKRLPRLLESHGTSEPGQDLVAVVVVVVVVVIVVVVVVVIVVVVVLRVVVVVVVVVGLSGRLVWFR